MRFRCPSAWCCIYFKSDDERLPNDQRRTEWWTSTITSSNKPMHYDHTNHLGSQCWNDFRRSNGEFSVLSDHFCPKMSKNEIFSDQKWIFFKINTFFSLVLLSGECSSSSALYFVIRLGDNPTTVPFNVHPEPRSKADWWMLVDFFGDRSCSSHHSCQCNHFNVFIWQWLVSTRFKIDSVRIWSFLSRNSQKSWK